MAWRDFFGVVEIDRVTIVPSWIEHEARAGQVVIRLDPGRAVGTAHHETPRLCLRALQDPVGAQCPALAVVTGSGILAAAAWA